MQEGGQPGPAPAESRPRRGFRYRSAFWGVVLVAIGVLLLLYNLDVISRENLAMLGLLWPILIVGIGVDLLVGRRSWGLGGLIGLVTVALIVALMFVGPSAGWIGDTNLKTETVGTPVGEATSARVSFDSSSYGANVHALAVSTAPDRQLLTAQVTYQGTLDFQASGETEKIVSISSKDRRWRWGWLDVTDAKRWDIGLDPTIPFDLKVRSASGSSELDLSGVRLTRLEVDVSSGDTQVKLPALAEGRYPVDLQLSSGDLQVHTAAGAQIDMSIHMSSGDSRVTMGADSDATVTFNGSSGEFTVDLASGQAVRVEVRSVSSGDVDLPRGLVRTDGGDDDDEEGTWETEGYGSAAHKVLVIIEHMSSGDVEVGLGG